MTEREIVLQRMAVERGDCLEELQLWEENDRNKWDEATCAEYTVELVRLLQMCLTRSQLREMGDAQFYMCAHWQMAQVARMGELINAST